MQLALEITLRDMRWFSTRPALSSVWFCGRNNLLEMLVTLGPKTEAYSSTMTMIRALTAAFVITVATGCGAGGSPELRARVDRLEAEVAALKSQGRVHQSAPAAAPRSARTCVDVNVPPSTQFPFVVDVERGSTSIKAGDAIEIREVRGTRPQLEQGGNYLVRGSYTLGSADEARLLLSVTAERPGEGCTSGNSRGSMRVSKGSGDFELATRVPYQGKPHVTFYVDGQNGGGVYFGNSKLLKK